MKPDPRVEFYCVGRDNFEDPIEGLPWGTEHQLIGHDPVTKWQSSPSVWVPVLGPNMKHEEFLHLLDTLLGRHRGPAFHFLVAYQENRGVLGTKGEVQGTVFKTASGADDLLQHSNARQPMWWRFREPPPPSPPPNRYQTLMGRDLF